MDLPATQICYDYDDVPTQKIEQPVEKEESVQVIDKIYYLFASKVE